MTTVRTLIHASSYGDRWFLCHGDDPADIFVFHEPNGPSGKPTRIGISDFLTTDVRDDHQRFAAERDDPVEFARDATARERGVDDLGARFDGYASKVMARSVAHIRKYVVVGAPLFARAMITLSGTVMPVETKTFDLPDEAAAWAYLAEAGPVTA